MKINEKPEIKPITYDPLPMLRYLENSVALLETHQDQDKFDLLWCNKKFETSLELSNFTANQVFDFKIFQFETILNQATKSQMTLYKLKEEVKQPSKV